MEISLRILISLFRPGWIHSGSVSWVDCGRSFPDKLRVSSFLGRFPHYACSPLWLHWVKGVCVFKFNLQPAFLAEWPGSFTCHCSHLGMEQTPNESQPTRLALEKKFSCRSCQDLNSQPFDHEAGSLPTSYPGSLPLIYTLKTTHLKSRGVLWRYAWEPSPPPPPTVPWDSVLRRWFCGLDANKMITKLPLCIVHTFFATSITL